MEQLRLALAASRAPLVLAGLGALSGVLAGLTIVALRGLIGLLSSGFMPEGDAEHFEGLSLALRVSLPLGGAMALGVLFSLLQPSQRRVGLMHVLQRLHFHDGQLPLVNIVVQFVGAAVALVSGLSVGRESPSIHLGAGISSQLSQALGLPNNTARVLIACGTAAGIAASFNTPLAGVVFAMEVVMMEYTVSGFAPVILAAVAATAITRTAFDASVEFDLPHFELMAIWELGMITLLGITIGVISVVFSGLIRMLQIRLGAWPLLFRFTLAGFVCAMFATVLPDVLGLGYDSVNTAIHEGGAVPMLMALLLVKILATSVCVGAGIPGGLIGPSLIVGGLGGALWTQGFGLLLETESHPGLYVLLGMGAMMSAMLQAPLAALLALLELTANPNLIMPAMLAIIAANLSYKEVLGRDSVIMQLMGDQGFKPDAHPMARSLARVGVTAVMHSAVVECPRVALVQTVRALLGQTPEWFSITDAETVFLVSRVDIEAALAGLAAEVEVDLACIPARRLHAVDVRMQATLLTAHEMLVRTGADAVRVTHRGRRDPNAVRVLGVLLPRDIDVLYRLPAGAAPNAGPD